MKSVAEVTNLRFEQMKAYASYVNAKAALLSIEIGVDVRPEDERNEQLDAAVEEHKRDAAWEKVTRYVMLIQDAIAKAGDCPDYEGIMQ